MVFDTRPISGWIFHSCDLSHASFQEADLLETSFRGSNLSFADLSRAKNLSLTSLAYTNLRGAVLPEALGLSEAVKSAAARSAAVQKTVYSVFGLYAYLFAAALASADTGLFVPTITTKLPIVQLDVPTRTFFQISMLLVVVSNFYLVSEISALLGYIRRLPAFLVDGEPIERALGAWTLFAAEREFSERSVLRAYEHLNYRRHLFIRLRDARFWAKTEANLGEKSGCPPFSAKKLRQLTRQALRREIGLVNLAPVKAVHESRREPGFGIRFARRLIVIGILGGFSIFVYFYLFIKFNRSHLYFDPSWFGNSVGQMLGLGLIVGTTIWITGRFWTRKDLNPPRQKLHVYAWLSGFIAVLLGHGYASDTDRGPRLMPLFDLADQKFGGASRDRSLVYSGLPWLDLRQVFDPDANVSRRDLSERPPGFVAQTPDDWSRVRSFPMDGLNLRNVTADDTFIAKASAVGAHFDGGRLRRSDLRLSRLAGASFVWTNLEGLDLREADASSANFSMADLSRARMEGGDFSGATFARAWFLGVAAATPPRLSPADKSLVRLYPNQTLDSSSPSPLDPKNSRGFPDSRYAEFTAASWMRGGRTTDFGGSNFTESRIGEGTSFANASLKQANLTRAMITSTNFDGADLSLSNLHGSFWSNCRGWSAQFKLVRLDGTRMLSCDLRRASFDLSYFSSRGSMIGQTLLMETTWRRFRRNRSPTSEVGELSFDLCNLSGSKWWDSKMNNIRFWRCDLSGARFDKCDLSNVWFTNCDLSQLAINSKLGAEQGINFSRCNLRGAHFRDCTLTVKLSGELVKLGALMETTS